MSDGRLPLWQRIGGTLAVAAVLAVLLILKLSGPSGNSHDQAEPKPSPTGSVIVPSPDVYRAGQVLDVVVDGADEWELNGAALVLLRDGGVVRRATLGSLELPTASSPLLALDRSRGVIWVVVGNAVPTTLIAYDSTTLRPLRTVIWRQLVYGAAALDGYLYLANDLGVAELSSSAAQPRFIAGLRGALGPVAADPTRHRVIALDAFTPLAIYSYRPGELPHESAGRLPLTDGTLAVADGNIWVGGYGDHGAARLYRLDPRTLSPVDSGRAPEFDPGAVVMSAGQDVVWIRNGGASSDLFACVDAATGRIEQRFHLSDVTLAASTGGFGVVATHQGVLPLTMGGCQG